MLSNHNACERTQAQLHDLFARSGWRVVQDHPVYAPRGSWLAAVVAEPVPLSVSPMSTLARLASRSTLRQGQSKVPLEDDWRLEIEEIDIGQSINDGDKSEGAEGESERSPTLVGSPARRAGRWAWPLKTQVSRSAAEDPEESEGADITMHTVGRRKGKGVQHGFLESEPTEWRTVKDADFDDSDNSDQDDKSSTTNGRKAKKEIGKRRSFWMALTGGRRITRLRERVASESHSGRANSEFPP